MTEKIYYTNSYKKRFTARVVSCEEKKGHWEIILNRTAFYPEGGGQPCDIGVLNCANVTDVQERGNEIVHTVDKPVPVGSEVMGGVNWDRRFRLMQQHSGEHIVSGIADRLYGADNVGFHMGEKCLTVDWNVAIGESGLKRIERMANEAVYQNLPIHAEFLPQEELEHISYRSKKALTGAVRIVTIPGYDVCACCGTHVAFTGEIGAIKILGSQNYKGGTRITMACGAQAMDDYAEKQESVAAISAFLSAKPEEVAAAVDRMKREEDDLKHRLTEARGMLLKMKVAAVPENCGSICEFEDDLEPDDLRRYALLLAERCGGTAAVFSGTGEKYRYAVANDWKDVRPEGKKLNAAFSGRGGGSKELIQGTVSGAREDIRHFFASVR